MRRGGGGNNNNSGGRRGGSSRSQSFESNGPDIKVRGNAQQIVDKYQTLAREAATAGNPVMAENYYQHAEHYHRVLSANSGGENRQNNRQQDGDDNRNNTNNNNNNADNNQQKSNGQAAATNANGGQNGSAAVASDAPGSPDANVTPVNEKKPEPTAPTASEAPNRKPSLETAEKTGRKRPPRGSRPPKAAEKAETAPSETPQSETVEPEPAPSVAPAAPESTDEGVKPV